MPLAYLLLCHRMPHAVIELFRAVYRREHEYLFHVDAKAGTALQETVSRLATALPNVHVLPPRLCSWGGWSLVETTLRGIDAALALESRWTHLVPLSEGHVPLCTPDAAAAALTPGVSRVEATHVAELDPHAQADVLHRLRARYRELPGVGMFPTAPRVLSGAFLESLYHGSQWLVLARDACERLRGLHPDGAAWGPFRSSLIADETALPTALLGTVAGQGLAIDRRPTTFVAWPHLSGNDAWTFADHNFFAAREAGFLFIRKRPRILPRTVARAVSSLAAPMHLPALPKPDESFTRGGPVATLATALHETLGERFPGIAIDTLAPQRAGCSPTCFLRLRCPGLPPSLHVALLSEDLETFKAVLAWSGQAEDDYTLRTLGGIPTWLTKVRLWDLFLTREMLLPDLPDAGFLTLGHRDGAWPIAVLLGRALEAGIALAPALAEAR
jgi:hypothetical protein